MSQATALEPSLRRQVSAIISREIQSRYTGDILGYGWVYVTPLAWIGLIYLVFNFLGRSSPIDANLGSFIISGVMPYLAFRYQVNALLRVKSSYRHVFILPGLSRRTVYFSIAALEFSNALLIYFFLLTLNYALSGAFEIDQPLLWLFGFFLASLSGAALGFAVSTNVPRADSASRIMAVVLRPLFYITPIFYIASELPQDVLWLIAWNPLLHAVEFLREGAFYSYSSQAASLWVPIGFIILCLIAGVMGDARLGSDSPASELVME